MWLHTAERNFQVGTVKVPTPQTNCIFNMDLMPKKICVFFFFSNKRKFLHHFIEAVTTIFDRE